MLTKIEKDSQPVVKIGFKASQKEFGFTFMTTLIIINHKLYSFILDREGS
jgi:hypothetical protein